MPREKITDQVTDGFYTEVSWRRMPGLDTDDQGTSPGHVQLATVNVHSPFEFPEVERGTSWEAGEKFDGWRVTLDEEGIDRLIRTLHKAKRQAFGQEQFAAGGVVLSGRPVQVPPLAPDEHVVRDLSTIAGHPQLRCIRPEHEGQRCYTHGGPDINAFLADYEVG